MLYREWLLVNHFFFLFLFVRAVGGNFPELQAASHATEKVKYSNDLSSWLHILSKW